MQEQDNEDEKSQRVLQDYYDIVVEDVLGSYYSDKEYIVLFPRVINACAKSLNVSYDALYDVVLAHETAHAVTHRCMSDESYTWKAFLYATTESKELLAQLIPFVYFERQEISSCQEAMEALSHHQRPKYTAYKSHPAVSGNKNALRDLVLHIRQEQESLSRKLTDFEPEWELRYHVDGGEQYSIRSSGVVFTADDKGDLFDAMQRGRRRPRVGRDTLDGIKTQIEIIQSLAISGEDALNAYRKGRRGLVTSVQFHVDYSGTLGGGVFDEYRSKQNHWGGHETEFEKLIQLVNQALQEAQQEVLI